MLFAGCCWGKPTTVPWAITFMNPYAAANVGTPSEHPAASDAALRSGRRSADSRHPRAGRTSRPQLSGPYVLALHALRDPRFIIEFYRNDPRGVVLMLSTSQFISVVLAPLAIVMLCRARTIHGLAPERAKGA